MYVDMVNNQPSRIKYLTLVALFAALTAAGAWIKIPLGPVPMTLQTLFIFLAGAILGPWWGGASQVTYLALGTLGLPVFAGGAGVAALLGPTGGYLVTFPFAAVVVGATARVRSRFRTAWFVCGMLVGLALIYGIGTLRLATVLQLPLANAAMLGVYPFLVGDAIKIAAAAVLMRVYLWPRVPPPYAP